MALLFASGFDYLTNTDLIRMGFNSAAQIQSGAGRNGGTAMGTFGSVTITKGLGANYSTLIAAFAIRVDGRQQSALFQFRDTTNPQCTLTQLLTAGVWNWSLRTGGPTGTVIATGATPIVDNTYYYIELKVTFGNAAAYELRINGVTEFSGTGDTTNTANNTADGWASIFNGTTGLLFDDMLIMDTSGSNFNNFQGDVRIATQRPDGAGNYTQWQPSAGSNYQNVDDAINDDDATYNAESNVGDKDSFSMSNLPSNGTVRGVQVTTIARKDDAGSRTLRNFLRIGGVDYEGASKAVTDTYLLHQDIFETDPSGGAWNQTKADALEVGVKVHA